jgi:hypothetical protein
MSPRPPIRPEMTRHGIVSGITIPPYFCQATAPGDCDNTVLRWPGPFSSGFLSPQPPGAVGIGPVRRIVYPHTGPTKVGPFSFGGLDFPSIARAARERLHSRHAIKREPGKNESDQFEKISAAACRPRRASGRACRDCRPGHRPPRHRRRRARCFLAARSSYWHCRSSRRPSANCARRCGR